jgi:hypothetical protein
MNFSICETFAFKSLLVARANRKNKAGFNCIEVFTIWYCSFELPLMRDMHACLFEAALPVREVRHCDS